MPRRPKRQPIPQQEETLRPPQHKTIQPLNLEQAEYIKAINRNLITLCMGRAGSGKTAIACGVAADWFNRGLVDKIIISRPVVGAEHNFGILPGEMKDKIDPYLTPLYTELAPFLNVKKAMAEERLIILPVSYMRGVTFKNSFVLIDEVQNLDYRQIKLILTRLGSESKMVLTGDASQSDLGYQSAQDFYKVIDRLQPIADDPANKLAIVELIKSVRHPLVEILLSALEE